MKIPLIIALAFGFVLLALAAQTDPNDPQLIEKLNALDRSFDEAFNRNDAAGWLPSLRMMRFWLGRKGRFTVVGPLSNGIQEFFRNGVAATISASVTNIPLTASEQQAMRFGAMASLA
jgi:hypothetical protein